MRCSLINCYLMFCFIGFNIYLWLSHYETQMIQLSIHSMLTFFAGIYLVEWNNCVASKQASKQAKYNIYL